ncbi:MAG: hypothetical protein ACFFC7_10030 [Candidatus Hermodarchaeota archaeon]
MNTDELINWLLESDEPVIRYKTYHELSNHTDESIENQLRKELTSSEIVQKWLNKPEYDKDQIEEYLNEDDTDFIRRFWKIFHGSKATCAENYLYKLKQLGLNSSFKEYDTLVKALVPALEKAKNYPIQIPLSFISKLLSGIGYYSLVKDNYDKRIHLMYDKLQETGFDIYLNPKEATFKFPSRWGHALVKPEYIVDDQLLFPNLYDLFVFSQLKLEKLEIWTKIEKIIEIIFDERYQRLKEGFGYGLYSNGKVYAIGYKIGLPGFFKFDSSQIDGTFLLKVFLMSYLPSATKKPWFKQSIKFLEQFKTDRGTYNFPNKILKESTSGYFIKGAYMGLSENRRSKNAKELESTFWMLAIKKWGLLR